MYGLINQALKDLVAAKAGATTWRKICLSAGISAEDFDELLPYDDALTYRLVELTAEALQATPEDILKMFGNRWVTFTANQGYGQIMEIFGRDLRTCLRNLNHMHGHMGAMMPDLHPPRFVVEEHAPNSITLHYHSARKGLGPLVIGILEGLADKFNEKIEIDHIPKDHRSDHDEFDISFSSL
jgi:hypothetical protein